MRADVDLLALICETPPPPEVCDGVGILYVRGPIDHHKNPLGVGCSYEQTCEWFHELNDNPEVHTILMCIDSPGGVVAGLNETVYSLREAAAKRVVAFPNEMATSAAFALTCVADETVLPRSAITGSIGVISTIASQARADAAAGIDFITITSGARKADGHPHMPIDQGAIDAETARVDELAAQFYELVQKTKGLTPKFTASLEAGIFLGEDAVALGIADRVESYDELLSKIRVAQNGMPVYGSATTPGDPMKVSLKALRSKVATARASYDKETDPKKRTGARNALAASVLTFRTDRLQLLQAALAKSTDPAHRKALSAKISAVLGRISAGTSKTKYRLEEEETTETDDEEEEEEGGNETDREERTGAESDDEDEEKAASAESEPEDPEKDEDKKESKKASAELAALRSEVAELRKRDAARTKADEMTARTSTIQKALAAKRITPAEAKTLATKDGEYIAAFLEARPKAVVLSPEEALRPLPSGAGAIGREEGGSPEAQVALTEDQTRMLADVSDPKLRAQIIKNWAARNAARETA